MFEFSRFYPRDFERGRDFVDQLDAFLAKLPTRDWDFGVEIRNASLLEPSYFDMLHSHGVAHVYVNNRLEGNALATIKAIIKILDSD